MKVVKFCILVVYGALLSTMAQADRVLVDANTGCSVTAGWDGPETGISWTGECIDGKIHGAGELTYLKGDEIYWVRQTGPGRGIVFQNGEFEWSFPDDIVYEYRQCSGFASTTAAVNIEYTDGFEVGDAAIRNRILRIVAEGVEQRCGNSGFDRIIVHIYPEGSRLTVGRGLNAETTSVDPIEWRTYNNYERDRIVTIVNRRNSRIEFERNAEIARQREIREAEAERRRNEAVVNRLNAFLSRHSVSAVILDDRVHTNPFLFVDRNIAVKAMFVEMISADTAIIEVRGRTIALSGIQATTFARTQYMFLALRLTGKGQNIHPTRGTMLMTEGQYVGHGDCGRNCDEYWSN